jgi:hypothetical protein
VLVLVDDRHVADALALELLDVQLECSAVLA